jgi:hypothetical protein
MNGDLYVMQASEQPVEKQQSSEFQDPLVQELTNMQIPLPSAPPATPLIQQPQLGPQMIDVMDMAPPQSTPGPQPLSDCSCPPDSSQVAVVPSGDKPTEKVHGHQFACCCPHDRWPWHGR